MHQNATCYGARPRPRRLCVRWRPSSPVSKKGAEPPIFGPCLLWPNGWMDEAGTWHGGRPQPRRLCVRWGCSPLPTKGVEPPPQTAGCIKMALGMEVVISPGDFGLDWDPAPPPKREAEAGGRAPNFRPMAIVAERLDGLRWHLHRGRPWSSPHCARWGHSSPPKNRGQSPLQFSAHLYCGQTAGCIKMLLGTEVGFGLRDIVFDVDQLPPEKGHTHPTQFLAHVYCGKMAGWMKTPLGMEVDLDSGHIVLDDVPAPAKGAQQPPLFGPCLLWPRSPI